MIEVCILFSWLCSSIISFVRNVIWFVYVDLKCCVLLWVKSWTKMIRYMNMNMICLFLCCSWIIWDSMHDMFLFVYLWFYFFFYYYYYFLVLFNGLNWYQWKCKSISAWETNMDLCFSINMCAHGWRCVCMLTKICTQPTQCICILTQKIDESLF